MQSVSTEEISRYKITATSPETQKFHLQSRETIALPAQLLPNTKWQLFLPLQNQESIFGILELQYAQENSGELGDFLLLQKLANTITAKLDF